MPDSASPSALFLAHLPEGQSFETYILEFPGGAVGQGSGVITTVAQVTAMVRVRSLARELPRAASIGKKKGLTSHQDECCWQKMSFNHLCFSVTKLSA